MLQSAVVAQSLGASPSVVVAALLHDIGYFLSADSSALIEAGCNTEHEALGAAWLSRAFGEAVTAPIALHVQAKRYLCAVEPGYYAQLSVTSCRSLMAQGGVMSAAEVAAFAKDPAFEAAVLLRRCDDHGKDSEIATPPLGRFRDLLVGALIAR